MNFENTNTYNLLNALRGMRNPYDSWEKSDSIYDTDFDIPLIGSSDMNLCKRLISGGNEHRKFLRQIFVSVDISAPFYWWKEMDTYKVGTTANSCSTMHTLLKNPITRDLFEMGDFSDGLDMIDDQIFDVRLDSFLNDLEQLRQLSIRAKADGNIELSKKYEKELIRWLPEGFVQKRTWTANYEILRNIYKQRKGHKLSEWHKFCRWVESLPYAKELIIE